MNDPWVTVALLGVVIFGFAWLIPSRRAEDRAQGGSDPAYEQLLEELETENRELLDAVAKFKQEQDQTIQSMVKQIGDLQRRMQEMAEEQTAANLMPTTAVTHVPATEADAASAIAEQSQADQPASPPMTAQQQVPSITETVSLPTSINERYAGLLSLYRKGKSIEQIAKSSGMNKGEVQLILQLARREEEQLA